MNLLNLAWEDILFQYILPYLSLKDCYNLRATSRSCEELIESYLATVKKINLSPYKNFTSTAFKVLSANCQSIRHLNLSYCKWVSDDLLQPLFLNNPHLEHVSLNGCLGLTSACLQPLIVTCKMKMLCSQRLRCLQVQNCHWMTVGCLDTLSFHQSNLEEVDLTSCWDLGDFSLITFVQKFSKLRVLCISNIYSVTNATMFAIASHCHKLQHLNVRGCWRITDEGVIMVGEYCRNLESLFVKDCHYISEKSLAALRPRMLVDKPRFSHYYLPMNELPHVSLNLQI